jgi:SAM-dependent methyltransferase
VLTPTLRAKLDALPDSALVLDVGGWARVDPRADWVIDIGSYATRDWYAQLGAQKADVPARVTEQTWVQADICASTPWPFDDGMFDYVLCMQTLEDVRDPVRVCEEIARVGRAGYIETPSAATELTRGVQSPHWCGWQHHRWLVEEEDGGLAFFGKPHHVHSPLWPAVRSPRLLSQPARDEFRFEWDGTFAAHEVVLHDAADIDRYLLRVVRDSARPDRVGDAVRAARTHASAAYRGGRRSLVRALRRR